MATATLLARLITSSHANGQVIDLTLDSDKDECHGIEPPPAKRARLEPSAQHRHDGPPNSSSRSTDAARVSGPQFQVQSQAMLDSLHRYVFPKIKRTLNHLRESEFDTHGIGEEIIKRLLRDGSLAAEGKATGWKISPERENMVDGRILSIFNDCKQNHRLPKHQPFSARTTESPRALIASAPWSPSRLAHRPGAEARRSSGSPATSQSPVPLPAYVKDQQQNGHSPSSSIRESPVPLPNHVQQRSQQGSPVALGRSTALAQAQPIAAVGVGLSSSLRPRTEQMRSIEAPRQPTRSPSFHVPNTSGVKPSAAGRSSRNLSPPQLEQIRELKSLRSPILVASAKSKGTLLNSAGRKDVASAMTDRIRKRPYLSFKERREIAECAHRSRSSAPKPLCEPTVYHIDFDDDELDTIKSTLKSLGSGRLSLKSIKDLPQRLELAPHLSSKLDGRSVDDVRNFLEELPGFRETQPRYQISLARDGFLEQERRRDRRLNTMRLRREMDGCLAVGASMTQLSLQTEALKDIDDSMGHTFATFGQCSGDVATMSWISETSLVCGATSTMDDRTLDHNRSGNLLLYCASTDALKSFKDHRERRAIKEGESEDFSRDRWLYPSIVASATDSARDLLYTASFDKTVKVWKTEGTPATSMNVVGTWLHEGKVNFVATALNGSGLVATAADVSTEAVRVYAINPQDPSASKYISLSCPRKDAHGSDEWGYWPSTLQWGTAEATKHLLAVGYSPRSRDGEESQIPEDKQRTGAILLWDSSTGREIPVYAPTMANVFEVVWHPTLPQLMVSTSRSGLHVVKGVRTQVRVWKQDPERMLTDQGWHEYKTLDCTAEDINELTVMPNSSHHAYVTASCTSGEIFVWDTARGDRPIHVLKHGPTVEPFENEDERKRRDVGVKFTAWGLTPDRLYTGSSDGKVNLWNVRKKRPFIRTVLQGDGAIFCGSFSPNKKILAIGDGPGNVWLLTDPDQYPESWGKPCRKRHVPVIADSDSEADGANEEDDADFPRKRYLDTGELVLTGNAVLGVVQGPSYHRSKHFDKKSHLNEDPTAPLIPSVERQQQAAVRATQRRKRSCRRLKPATPPTSESIRMHADNRGKDFDIHGLDSAELTALKQEGADLDAPDEDFDYESDY